MEQYDNPILDAYFGDSEFEQEEAKRPEFDAKKFAGKWPKAMLMEVTPKEANEYGRSLGLKYHLDPDKPESTFSFFVDAPIKPEENGSPDAYEKKLKRYQVQLNRIKTLVHATGLWCEFNEKGYKSATKWPKELNDFSNDDSYQRLVTLFQNLVGTTAGLNIRIEDYEKSDGSTAQRKNVWGLDPKRDV